MCKKKFYLIKILVLMLATSYCSAAEEQEEETKTSDSEESDKEKQPDRPHIIFILADDLGWNDVGFSGNSRIPTPNIDALASSSLILSNYYTEASCTPSRASLLTGKYPIHIGLNSEIKSGESTALPLHLKILPEYLKNLGYVSHIVGKWHLGYSRKEYTPTYRGFDSFFGFYNDQIDYFDYTNYDKSSDPNVIMAYYGVDLQSGTKPIMNQRGRYITEVLSEKVVEIVENHNESTPLFLYVSHLAGHNGNEYMPLQAPFSSISKVGNFSDRDRRTFAAMVNSLDESVGKLVDALYRRNFLQNTIIIFTSDGGSTSKTASSSWPLRGRQPALWEGAIRVPGLIWSPLLGLKFPRTANQMMHVSDWLPTIFSAAGGSSSELGVIDGFNMWEALLSNSQSPRIEILHGLNLDYNTAALRRGDYKLLKGKIPGDNDLWYGIQEMEFSDSGSSLERNDESIVKPILKKLDLLLINESTSWLKNIIIQCNPPLPEDNIECNPDEYPCLFNIAADPCEYKNLARRYPRVVRSMLRILNKYNETTVENLKNATDPRADPRCHGFAFVPWMDEEYAADCPNYLIDDNI